MEWADGRVLPRAVRWHPRLHDVNSLPGVEEVRAWVAAGLALTGSAWKGGAPH